MKYELSPYPLSFLFRIIISYEATSDVILQTEKYALVGGSLLHKLKWMRGCTYGKIANTYAVFTSKHYGYATVVFGGYVSDPSIRDNTHQRLGQTTIYPMVNSTGETEFEGKKE